MPRIGVHLALGLLLSSCWGATREDILGSQADSTLGGAGEGGADSAAGAGGSAAGGAGADGGTSGNGGAPHTGGSAGSGGTASTNSGGAAGIMDDGDDGHGGSQAIDPGLFEGNLITDPSFEAGHSGWAPFGTATIVDVEGDAHGGLKYIAATNRSQQWMGPVLAVDSLVTGGTSYEVSAWVRVTGENLPTNLTLRSSCEGNPDTTYTVLASDTVGDEWTLLTGTFAAPTCAILELDIVVEGPPAGVDIFVDDVALRALP